MKMEEEKAVYYTFTGANACLLINDAMLGSVADVSVEDIKNEDGTFFTQIILNKTVNGFTEELVEVMRRGNFSFKLSNNTTSSGWVALECILTKFKMTLESGDVLKQHLVIHTNSFVYADDVRGKSWALKEKEEYETLVAILKASQKKSAQEKNVAVLPDVCIKDPAQPAEVKPKKKNKK